MLARGVGGVPHAPAGAEDIAPPVAIFAGLVEYWDATLGYALVDDEVDTWTGQHAGTVLQAPGASQRPSYESSSVNFAGRPVVVTDRATARYMTTAVDALSIPANSQPYVFAVARNLETSLATDNHVCAGLFTNTNFSVAWITTGANGRETRIWTQPGSPFVSQTFRIAPGTTTTPALFEIWHDGSAAHGAINEVEPAVIKSPGGGADGTGTFFEITQAAIGSGVNGDPATGGSFEITLWGIALNTTSDERAAFRDYASGLYS